MAQIDPGTTSAAVPSTFHEYSSPTRTNAFRATPIASSTKPISTVAVSGQEASSLLGALVSAADKTSASIAQGTRQSREEGDSRGGIERSGNDSEGVARHLSSDHLLGRHGFVIHKRLQQVNGRDRNDRSRDLDLQRPRVEFS